MDSIKIYNCDTLKEDLLFNRNIIQQGDVGHGLVSPTARYILIPIRKDKDEKVITMKIFFGKENILFVWNRLIDIIQNINMNYMKNLLKLHQLLFPMDKMFH